jgi:hypothetical protein
MRKALRHLDAEPKRALRFVLVVLLFDSCWATCIGEGSSVHESTVSHQAGLCADQRQGVVTMRDPDTGVSILWLPHDQADSDTGYFRL